MRYFVKNPTTTIAREAVLLDLIVAVLLGNLDQDLSLSAEAGEFLDTQSAFMQCVTTFDTPVIPLNGVSANSRYPLGLNQSDKRMNIQTEDKAVKGNLIVLYDLGLSADEKDQSAFDSAYDTLQNQIDRVATNWSIETIGFASDNPLSIPSIEATTANPYVAIGTLKRTQTEDYNPLDVITADYIMVDPDYIKGLATIEEEAEMTKEVIKAQLEER